MATVIRASCHDCGNVELAVSDVQVRVCTQDQQASYVFRCPSCHLSVTKSTEPRIVDLLVASGVPRVEWQLPAELFEARVGQPISYDDLIDFHRLLLEDGWFEALVASS